MDSINIFLTLRLSILHLLVLRKSTFQNSFWNRYRKNMGGDFSQVQLLGLKNLYDYFHTWASSRQWIMIVLTNAREKSNDEMSKSTWSDSSSNEQDHQNKIMRQKNLLDLHQQINAAANGHNEVQKRVCAAHKNVRVILKTKKQLS